MAGTSNRRSGFTIVELLVVIAIITVLLGLLLPAIGGVQRRGRKLEEINRIRQIGIAWDLYATSNKDSALPGYLEEEVQITWRVGYRFPTKDSVPMSDAATWPWRLLPYLDFNQDTVLGYLGLDLTSQLAMSDETLIDPEYIFPAPQPVRDAIERPTHIALAPAFGYNGYYVGGWWTMVDLGGEIGMVPNTRFYNATEFNDPVRISVVARSPGTIQSGADFVLFCSSAPLWTGTHHRLDGDYPGAAMVVPPILADQRLWERARVGAGGSGSDEMIEVVQLDDGEAVAAPIGRHTGQASVLYADLHTAPEGPGALDDQRLWIRNADKVDWKHKP